MARPRERSSQAGTARVLCFRRHFLGVRPLNESLDAITAWLYRHRGTTAAPFALLAVIGARPSLASILGGGTLVLAGEMLRLWAASFIGPHSRGMTLRAPRLVTDGPYGFLRHPLYAGNGLVCAGLLIFSGAFQPWLPLIFVPAFLAQYALFITREERFLATEWGSQWEEYRSKAVGRSANPGVGPGSGNGVRFRITREGWNLEWSTVRTILGLMVLCVVSGLWKSAAG